LRADDHASERTGEQRRRAARDQGVHSWVSVHQDAIVREDQRGGDGHAEQAAVGVSEGVPDGE
jgi:hypothetical protein